MKVIKQLVSNNKEISNTTNQQHYLMALPKGANVIVELRKFAQQNNIASGFISGIGASSQVQIGKLENGKYIRKTFSGEEYEVLSLIGNFTFNELTNSIEPHVHITFCDNNNIIHGGHLFETIVGYVMEINLTVFVGEVNKVTRKKTNDWEVATIINN